MSNLTFTLSIDENVLQKLERLAARKHKNVAALVHDYLVSLSETAETSEDRDRAEGEARGPIGRVSKADSTELTFWPGPIRFAW